MLLGSAGIPQSYGRPLTNPKSAWPLGQKVFPIAAAVMSGATSAQWSRRHRSVLRHVNRDGRGYAADVAVLEANHELEAAAFLRIAGRRLVSQSSWASLSARASRLRGRCTENPS
jgi:hypothetical protein